MQNWKADDVDRRIATEIRESLPDKLTDFHAHLYRVKDLALEKPGGVQSEGPAEVSPEVWREKIGELFGKDRLKGALFIPFPTPAGDIETNNTFVTGQLKKESGSRGLILVGPEVSEEHIQKSLEMPGVVGFKPYHVYSPQKPTFDSPIASFLPDWILKIADEKALVITLHMVKEKSLADPENQREIREICGKYPNIRLVLAHAARGFHAPHTVKHIQSLRGLQNVWFDTSAICEPDAFYAVLDEFGPRKLLWGTDFPVSHIRGKAISLGEGFFWLYMNNINWEKRSPATTENPTFVGLESIRALLRAIEYFSLNGEDKLDIFHGNAVRLLGLEKTPDNISQDLYLHAKEHIPGGTQLLSKKPERMAPNIWPPYFREARGCETWDLDGRHYYDVGTNAIGACLLGFRDPDVTRAVKRVINLGSKSSLNPPEEVELADRLFEIHPWADQARFARTGGETATIAIRIARATTDRSHIAICGYHGWHDWYLAANLGDEDTLRGHLFPGLDPYGVPRELRGTAHPFEYEDRKALQEIIDRQGDKLAAVIMEPCRYKDPEPGFLEFVKESARKVGALLIFDEITIGFRLKNGGAHLKFGVNPDIAIFAKALGSGHPIGAIIGTKEAMDGANYSFISSTYFTERVGPAAALATLKKFDAMDVPAHLAMIGNRVMEHWKRCGEKHGLPVVTFEGYPCLGKFHFEHEENHKLSTLYTQLMVERGFLCGTVIYATTAHTEEIIDLYGEAIDDVFGEIARAIETDNIDGAMRGPASIQGFRRLL